MKILTCLSLRHPASVYSIIIKNFARTTPVWSCLTNYVNGIVRLFKKYCFDSACFYTIKKKKEFLYLPWGLEIIFRFPIITSHRATDVLFANECLLYDVRHMSVKLMPPSMKHGLGSDHFHR